MREMQGAVMDLVPNPSRVNDKSKATSSLPNLPGIGASPHSFVCVLDVQQFGSIVTQGPSQHSFTRYSKSISLIAKYFTTAAEP